MRWSAYSILTSFLPLWTLSLCVMLFDKLLVQYWPRFYHFELSGGAECHLMRCWSSTDLVSTMNTQEVRNAIWWATYLILTLCLPLWTLSGCVMPFEELMIQYWHCSTTLKSQRVRNAVWWAAHSILTLVATTLDSQEVINAIWWVADSILNWFLPLWTCSGWVTRFDKQITQYWPRFHHLNSQQVRNAILWPLIRCWPRFYDSELSASA